tara:strand:+ start:797 stop:1006 length:210 start_codon:yes stop_codon:yes gene_type:complete
MAFKHLALVLTLTGCTVNHTQYQSLEATTAILYVAMLHEVSEEQREFIRMQEEVNLMARELDQPNGVDE